MNVKVGQKMNRLMVCNFNNGNISLGANVCNIYDVLTKLRIISPEDCGNQEAICWVRYWPHGFTFQTMEQLEYALLNKLDKIRISFFTTMPLTSAHGIPALVREGHIPALKTSDAPPTNMTVYTLWFLRGCPQLAVSGINQSRHSIEELFDHMSCGYRQHYQRSVDSFSEDENDQFAVGNRTNIRTSYGSTSGRS